VENTRGKPVRGIEIGVEGLGSSAPTGTDGKVRLRVGKDVEEGEPISLIVERSPQGKDYVMISPWTGRTLVPSFREKPDNFIQVVVGQRGDRSLLESGVSLKSFAEQVVNQFAPRPGDTNPQPPDPKAALATVAKQYGLSSESLDEAIRNWAKNVTDPFDKGLADFYKQDYPLASTEFEKSLNQREATLRSDTDLAAKTAFFLGASRYSQGQYHEAARAFERSHELHPDELFTLYVLARTLMDAGEYIKAEAFSGKALALARKTLQEDDPALASALDNAGLLLVSTGKPEQAEPLIREAIAIDLKRFGPVHHNLAASLNSLGVVLQDQHKNVEAATAYRDAIEMDDRILGPDNLESASYRTNLASLHIDMREYQTAEQELRSLLTLRETKLGPEHPEVAQTLHWLSRVLTAEKRWNEAETCARRELAIDQKEFSSNSLRIYGDLKDLGVILKFNSKYEESESDLSRAAEIAKSVMGPDSIDYAEAMDEHALTLLHMGEFERAEQETRVGTEVLGKNLKDTDPALALAWEGLALILEREDKDSEAQKAFSKALDSAQKGLGSSHYITRRIAAEAVAHRAL
jgi:tetratricopeptide (TPR) repeat protein